ncbi:hypothetical protein BBK82_30185 [Lentzea guizhouensis]|uniref:Phosphoenolpyruvate synthase n=1 Tax=Lentzea guizhouensis TaxID=1586287 RepID=A0A1B2HZK4_9PSEU|nr:hypothetical protein BBK82_30185 [Lentzea guizhouensis]
MVRLGTKADTLDRLRPFLTTARILPLVHFTSREWRDRPDRLLAGLRRHEWAAGPVMVRSSATTEDTGTDSNAGRFRSVPARNQDELAAAVDEVFASYGRVDAQDQVLIQPLLERVRASGVAFSCDPNSGAPYRVVNWSATGRTDAVTGGGSAELHISYGAAWADPAEAPDPQVGAVWELLAELHNLLGEQRRLDIEFAFSDLGELILLQVRPLTVTKVAVAAEEHRATLTATARQITETTRSRSRVLGHRAVYGVMPDWNPAEMIGLRPRPLAVSLYRHLITDQVWAAARARYGYRDLTGTRLMVQFSGLPYVDVAASFTSFVPREVPDELAGRLVGHWLDQLVAKPYLHDKVESHIAVSAGTFRTAQRLEALAGFSAGERDRLAGFLRRFTGQLVRGDLWEQDIARLRLLNEADNGETHAAGCSADDIGCCGPALVARLDVCAAYGSSPFAALARAAFIATDLLDDLVREGVLSPEDRARFIGGLRLVASEMRRDFAVLDRAVFLKRYGQLRPGTYDILSPRYDETPERYFDWSAQNRPAPGDHATRRPFELSGKQRRQVEALLVREGLTFDVARLMDFMTTAIRGREHGKLAFTSVLGDVLTGVRRLGERSGCGVDDMSYLDVTTLATLTGDPAHDLPVLREVAARGRAAHAVSQTVVLPPLVTGPADVRSFALPQIRPNFVTRARATARVALVDVGDTPDGAIVLVASADPGYDWLFTRGIAGLVTAFGGANSHMAIRALELGIPAVIGAGTALFDQWSRANVLELDAASGLVTVIA